MEYDFPESRMLAIPYVLSVTMHYFLVEFITKVIKTMIYFETLFTFYNIESGIYCNNILQTYHAKTGRELKERNDIKRSVSNTSRWFVLTLTQLLSRHHLKHRTLLTTQSPTTLFLVPLSNQASGSPNTFMTIRRDFAIWSTRMYVYSKFSFSVDNTFYQMFRIFLRYVCCVKILIIDCDVLLDSLH